MQLKALLEPFGITRYHTDGWEAYTRHLDLAEHNPGKWNMEQIERKHVALRTRIKRLTCKTICFSRSIQMHDLIIGLFVNRYAFGCRCETRKVQICNMTVRWKYAADSTWLKNLRLSVY